eukprot:6443409-Pyramimonas_sp.AAC.1
MGGGLERSRPSYWSVSRSLPFSLKACSNSHTYSGDVRVWWGPGGGVTSCCSDKPIPSQHAAVHAWPTVSSLEGSRKT